MKRLFDLIAAALALVLLAPLLIVLALLVRRRLGAPMLFRHRRPGRGGRIFMLYKFRTMRTDAEKNGAQWSPGATDTRVTALGKFLRASHLDELPQLWNVIRGDLSFV